MTLEAHRSHEKAAEQIVQRIEDFEKKLVGMKKGEEGSHEVDFPEGHQNPILAGKKVEFKIVVKDVVITSYSIHYTKLYEKGRVAAKGVLPTFTVNLIAIYPALYVAGSYLKKQAITVT